MQCVKSEDSGHADNTTCSVSTTHGDVSTEPCQELSGDHEGQLLQSIEQPGEEETDRQQHVDNSVASIEPHDEHEQPRFSSIEELQGEVMMFQHVNFALPGQTTGSPPDLPVVTRKSGATRKMMSIPPPPPRPLPNSTWAEESTGGNPSRQDIPAVPPAVEEVAHNVPGGTRAKEAHESGHATAIGGLHRENSQHNCMATATTSSVGEPQPDVQEVHGEQDISMVTAGPDNCLFIQQMVVMESQPPAPPEVLCIPSQQSEAGQNEPAQLVL